MILPSPGAHPRSRGENAALDKEGAGVEGSSPLTRGKPKQFSVYRYGAGLIPAHAGKTARSCTTLDGAEAHPRSRGENLVRPGRRPAHAGSSPLTRGKP